MRGVVSHPPLRIGKENSVVSLLETSSCCMYERLQMIVSSCKVGVLLFEQLLILSILLCNGKSAIILPDLTCVTKAQHLALTWLASTNAPTIPLVLCW